MVAEPSASSHNHNILQNSSQHSQRSTTDRHGSEKYRSWAATRDSLVVSVDNTNPPLSTSSRESSSATNMACLGETTSSTAGGTAGGTVASSSAPATTETSAHPRRNLTEAFDALCVEESSSEAGTLVENDDATATNTLLSPPVKKTVAGDQVQETIISPTGVADLHDNVVTSNAQANPSITGKPGSSVPPAPSIAGPDPTVLTHSSDPVAATTANVTGATNLPHLELHTELKLELSQALVNRVSFYGIIHDINKEASSMAASDPLPANKVESQQATLEKDEHSVLVQAVTGGFNASASTSSSTKTNFLEGPSDENCQPPVAVIDEEDWLLSTIAKRSPTQESRGTDNNAPASILPHAGPSAAECPPTFLQAMGEKEYENPVASLSSSSRTQLWKPSRSWWEAKSGKNPWIEPSSHNKRWRYLWPLIHYHKFLAKCIKKLKRNGVDVKQSVSPVAVFLREEVCAVSDHLAAVSLFGSEEWMQCLQHFTGWTDTSPTSQEMLRQSVARLKLRSLQEPADVDSPLLRSQIDEQFLRAMEATRLQMRESCNEQQVDPRRGSGSKGKTRRDNHSGNNGGNGMGGHGHPPMYPRAAAGSPAVPRQAQQPQSAGRRNRWPYPPQQHGGWWNPAWMEQQHQQQMMGDSASVQSGLSNESSYPSSEAQPPYPSTNNAFMYGHALQSMGHAHPAYFSGPPANYPPQSSDHSESSSVAYDYTANSTNSEPSQHGIYDPTQQQSQQPEQQQPHPQTWMDHAALFYAMQHHQPHQQHGVPGPGYYGPSTGTPTNSQHSPSPLHQEHSPYHHQQGVEESDIGGQHSDAHLTTTSPYKYDPHHQQPLSPFWAHLDRATVAMGLATPAKASPSTPKRSTGNSSACVMKIPEGSRFPSNKANSKCEENRDDDGSNDAVSSTTASSQEFGTSAEIADEAGLDGNAAFASTAQPLLFRHSQYYGYGPYGAQEGYGPPSPATQFMMSPQASFAYNYGYGFSPRRPSNTSSSNCGRSMTGTVTPKSSLTGKPETVETSPPAASGSAATSSVSTLTPPPHVRKVVANKKTPAPGTLNTSDHRESPSTEGTIVETEILEPKATAGSS